MTELLFEKKGTQYECNLGVAKGIVQVEFAESNCILAVRANLPSMKPSVIQTVRNPYSDSVIFELNLADGMEVTLVTSSEVKKAQIM